MNGSISGRLTPTNGLCEPCNRNQELKVQQMASFEPENEAYFDEEIQEYRYVWLIFKYPLFEHFSDDLHT